MKSHHLIPRFLSTFVAFAGFLNAEPETTPISFSEIGAKATAEYQGDAIGISIGPEMVRLHTGFQKLAGNVTSEGLTLASTEENGGSLKLTAVSIGRDSRDELYPVFLPTSGKVLVEEKLVRWIRQGLVEEYSVSADGVRQDFIIGAKPPGSGALSVELALSGANAKAQGDGVHLTLETSGRELAYTRLRVEDAAGRSLPARFGVIAPNRLAILVEDEGAVYPVRIDPTFSDADWLNDMNSSIPGTNDTVWASIVDGSGNLYIGGDFTFVGGIPASRIAKWNGTSWSALGTGLNGRVEALALIGTDLYAGGSFSTAGGVAANLIAKWSGSTWSALSIGLIGTQVSSFEVSGSDLYVGGDFGTTGPVLAANIARWNGSAWSALGTSVNNDVLAIAISGTDVYVGGSFTQAGGVPALRIAKWNGSAWSALGTGIGVFNAAHVVDSLAVNGSDLYVGGIFTSAGGVSTKHLAKWNGSSWSGFTGSSSPPFSDIQSLKFIGTDLYAGGRSSSAKIAKWNGSVWTTLETGANSAETVFTLAVTGTNLYAGGYFATVGGVACSRIAKWDGTGWSRLNSGMDSNVSALAVNGTDLYVGGGFTTVDGLSDARFIAKWNGSEWSALGTGMNGAVRALATDGTNLYAGGNFTSAGGVAGTSRIAKWNGSNWEALGTGWNGAVLALAVNGTDLYAGGSFFNTGLPVYNIAKWNGISWSGLGTGLDGGPVHALAFGGMDLYAGGSFTISGGAVTNYIAKWNGSEWSALGDGVNSAVRALAASGTDLYVGGDFTTAGGVSANRIARWDGSAWFPVGTGLYGSVRTLAVTGSNLYAGGVFTTAGGVSASRIAKWNGNAWSSLASGVNLHGTGSNTSVDALVIDSSGELILGGNFLMLGTTTVAPYIAQAKIAPAPDIAITGNGTEIVNGDATPDITTGTDFNGAVESSGSVVRVFTITNSGTGDLVLTGTVPDYVTVSGSSAFSVTEQPTFDTIPANGGTQTFQVRFAPTTLGPHAATVSISNNDADENPFTFTLAGEGITAQSAATNVIAAAGLTGEDAELDAAPFNDGVENLLKYAFNMNLAGPDASTLPPGTGTSGLPLITTPDAAPPGTLRFEFLRRKGSGLVYAPQKSTTLDGPSWSALTAAPVIESIDDQWERVVYTEAPDPVPAPACFGRVEVAIP